MSRGKYSPATSTNTDFRYNCYGELPPETWAEYDEKIHFGNYDSEGFDSYGYSAFYSDGSYAGVGSGVDRNGITEYEYLCMSEEEFAQY